MDIDKQKCEQYLEDEFDDVIWSPSTLKGYSDCPFSFYSQKVLKIKSPENFYSYMGTGVHQIFEDYYNVGFGKDLTQEVISDTMVRKFTKLLAGWEGARPHGFKKYCDYILNSFYCFRPLESFRSIEEEIFFDYKGIKMRGILDIDIDENYHGDYKSLWDRSKYEKQQYIYMLAKEAEYGVRPPGS
jgi:hypothetical protein